jgi:hypothetical protein
MRTGTEIMRFKVIAQYPCAMYKMGSIVETYEDATAYIVHIDGFSSKKECLYSYPAIFRKMEWWEGLEVDEIPKYLKVNSERTSLFFGHIHKVRRAVRYEYPEYLNEGASELLVMIEGNDDLYKFDISVFLPSTESEYNEFKSAREK